MNCSPQVSSLHGLLQAKILEWAAVSSSRGSSRHRDGTCIPCVPSFAGGFFTIEGSPYSCILGHFSGRCHHPEDKSKLLNMAHKSWLIIPLLTLVFLVSPFLPLSLPPFLPPLHPWIPVQLKIAPLTTCFFSPPLFHMTSSSWLENLLLLFFSC